jgi:four helix bundle protein
MQDHTKLRVWQRAHALTVAIVLVTARPEFRSMTGLAAQLRRAAGAVGANIAEGAGQESPAQFARFLTMAIASSNEVLSHLQLARDIGALSREESDDLLSDCNALRAMTLTLLKRVREREAYLQAAAQVTRGS